MEIVDRKKGPKIQTDYNIQIPEFMSQVLGNGLKLFAVNSGTQDIIKIELVFRTGRVDEIKRASAKTTFQLIREGSQTLNADELANKFDFYGAYIKIFSGLEYASISIVTLCKYFEETWGPFLDMIKNPAFEEPEINKYTSVASQRLTEQLVKNDIISFRVLTEQLFGESHPYGYNTEPEDFLKLSREDLVSFFDKNVGFNNAAVVLSGRITDNIRTKVISDLEQINKQSRTETIRFNSDEIVPDFISIPSANQAQTSLKMGRLLFQRLHPDYSKMQVLNTILGGYFGSRLMKNIREDKGYTYGIYSSLETWKKGGFLYISADLANDSVDQTLEEIRKEFRRLKSELVPMDEFIMVKNFMLGQCLHLIDGPFATGQLIKNVYAKDLDIEHFKNHIEEIKTISRNDILELAIDYLDENTFSTVLAGNF